MAVISEVTGGFKFEWTSQEPSPQWVLLKELSCVVKNTPEVNYMED